MTRDEREELETRPRPLPSRPTRAAPGSEEKIRVLMERADRREELHHPDDVNILPYDKREGPLAALGIF